MMAAPISSTDSQSTPQSYSISSDDMTGIERAKALLEQAIRKMTDLFKLVIELKEKKTAFPANIDLVMVMFSACTLMICYLALEEEDDSDEEESGTDSDEYCENEEEQPPEMEELTDPDNASVSDSLASTLATTHMRSRLERHRGIKRAKLALEQIIRGMINTCSHILEREGAAGINRVRVTHACASILLICYQGLDEEDDSDEEQSAANADDSCEVATEDEYFESAGAIASDAGSKSEPLSSIASSQTAIRSKRKRRRHEEPCLVTRSTRNCCRA